MTAQETLAAYDALCLRRDAAALAVQTSEAAVRDADDLTLVAEQVRTFFNVLSEKQRMELEQKVQAIVDFGVQAVFGPSYRFKVVSELRGKSVRTEFFLVEDGNVLPLLDATGGGIGDVVSFLLRVVMLCMARPAQRRLLVLDEPFKWLSEAYFGKLCTLLTELTQNLGLQVIMVMHRPELLEAATTVVRVTKAGKSSTAEVSQLAAASLA